MRLHSFLKNNDENNLFEKEYAQRISVECDKFQMHKLCSRSSAISTACDMSPFMHVTIIYAVNIFFSFLF